MISSIQEKASVLHRIIQESCFQICEKAGEYTDYPPTFSTICSASRISKSLWSYYLFIFSTKLAAFSVISTHPGTKPLRNAFLTDFRFDQAQQ